MKINSATRYPHPVVDALSDDFTDANFECQIVLDEEVNPESRMLGAKCRLTLNQNDLNQLVLAKKCIVGVMIECSETFYKKLELVMLPEDSFQLEADKLYGKVLLTPILFSSGEIHKYSPSGMHAEFSKAEFQIHSGRALAIAPTLKFMLRHDKESHLETVFKFVTQDDMDDHEFKVGLGGERVEIYANEVTLKDVQDMRSYSTTKKILLNSLYLPVLVNVVAVMLESIKSDEQDMMRKRWFQAILDVSERENLVINENADSFEIAQRILRSPFRGLVGIETGLNG